MNEAIYLIGVAAFVLAGFLGAIEILRFILWFASRLQDRFNNTDK